MPINNHISPITSPHTQTQYITEFLINWDLVNIGTNCQVNTKCQHSLEFCKHPSKSKSKFILHFVWQTQFPDSVRQPDRQMSSPRPQQFCQKDSRLSQEFFLKSGKKMLFSIVLDKILRGQHQFSSLQYVRPITLFNCSFHNRKLTMWG